MVSAAQIKTLDEKISKECQENEGIRRLETIPGVGEKTALARKLAKLLYLIMKSKGEEYKELPAPTLQAG